MTEASASVCLILATALTCVTDLLAIHFNKEKLVGLGLVGATCLSIFHSFFGLFMFSMISFLTYAALAFAIFLTTWLRKFLYIDLARIFDFVHDLNWSLRCIRCMIYLFIQGGRHLRFTLFLTMGM